MKLARSLLLGTLTALGVGANGIVNPLVQPAEASQFAQAEVDQSRFVAMASPYAGGSAYRLVILEQIRDTRPCWQESGSSPTTVNPLLLTFDYTDICGRNPDSNGYSVRVGGEDLGTQYSLRVRRRGNDLVLLAEPANRGAGRTIEIGRSYGIADGQTRINLNPGWRFAKRVFNGQRLGHVYVTNDQPLETLVASSSGYSGPSSSDDYRPAPVATRPSPSPSNAIEIPVIPPDSYDNTYAYAGQSDLNPPAESSSEWNGNVVGTLPVPAPPPTPRGQRPPGDNSLPLVSIGPPSGSSGWSSGAGVAAPSPLAAQLGFSYRVIVQATTADAQARVRAIAPDAFRTIVNGQTVMQAGLFRTQSDAQALQQTLSNQNLSARVVAVQ